MPVSVSHIVLRLRENAVVYSHWRECISSVNHSCRNLMASFSTLTDEVAVEATPSESPSARTEIFNWIAPLIHPCLDARGRRAGGKPLSRSPLRLSPAR